MAAVNYLTGNERPTADLMNELFAALDDKLTRILGGRSFFLAQTAQMPPYLVGKAFFFTAGNAVYAPRVPGYIENGTTNIARPYNHAQFASVNPVANTTYLSGYMTAVAIANGGTGYSNNDVLPLAGGTGTAAAVKVISTLTSIGKILAVTIVSAGNYTTNPPNPNSPTGGTGTGAILTPTFTEAEFDEVNKTVVIPPVDATHYLGLPQAADVAFLDWSLAAHYLMTQRKSDKQPTRYYLREAQASGTGLLPPEKHFKFALAEIIMEGVQAVTIETSWDKYSCFRVHNLNPKAATLKFADSGYTVNLGPFQCATVRRDWIEPGHFENYRAGHTYFFKYEGGDPRCYWFFPTSGGNIGYGGRAANSMQANNLSNPAILFDWLQFFQRKADGLAVFAGLNDDPAVQCDISAFYKNLFGDPANPATLVGDLLHHKGDIKIVRISMSKREPVSGNPLITFDSVTFNGYATIVADFAEKKLQVQENAAGNLVVTNIDPDNNVFLCPVSTNLFKVGDNIDGNWLGLISWGLPAQFSPGVNNGAEPTDKGIPLLSTFNPNGSTSVVIENAIFESEPEQPWLDTTALSPTGPQLIQQPIPTTTAPQQTWYDINNIIIAVASPGANYQDGGFAGAAGPPGAHFWIPAIMVNGTPQTTLNWNRNARGLLAVPTILDGGSGYEDGDQEQLAGGSGNAAVVSVTSTTNGKVTEIAIAYPGDYTSAPPNPNAPFTIYPTDRSGRGLRLGGIIIPIQTLNGIHKTTVADLLKLDWWGDPRAGDQSSDYVVIENRKLTLTPQGLVLSFTETDSPLAGDTTGQPASLPVWASGRRGLPRQRAFRFRGHGFGFVGGASDTENMNTTGFGTPITINVPPSAKSGMVTPRYGRFEIGGGYQGEIVAPNGGDFSDRIKTKQNTIKLLTRVRAAWLASPGGRFWQGSGIDRAANFLPQMQGAPAPYFFETWEFLSGISPGYPANVLAMGLLPEMYNALARAVNATTSGTPLQWQCLFFNVGGKIINLDPTSSFGIGGGSSGNTRADGTHTTSPGLAAAQSYYCNWQGPRPLNQFGAFDPGSLYERLCNQLGIPVRTEADLPGAANPNGGDDLPLSFFQNQFTTPAVYFDFAQGTASLFISGGDILPYTFIGGDFGPGGPVPYDIYSANVTMTLTMELLSSKALLDGKVTGSRCIGTYDPALFTGRPLIITFGQPPIPAYPDFSNANPGDYYVASDGSGYVCAQELADTFDGYTSGQAPAFGADFPPPNNTASIGVNGSTAALLTTSWGSSQPAYLNSQGVASYPGNELNIVHGYGLYGGVNLNGFFDYRWVQAEDIQELVTSLGFPFLWVDLCTPLALKYFEDQTEQTYIANQGTTFTIAAGTSLGVTTGDAGFGSYYNLTPPDGYAGPPPATAIQFNNSGMPGHGTLIKFCVTTDPTQARWKISAIGAPLSGGQFVVQEVAGAPINVGISSGLGVPGEVLTIKSRQNLSPWFRYLFGNASAAVKSTNYPGPGTTTQSWNPSLSVNFNPAVNEGQQTASFPNPQLVAQYVQQAQMDGDFSDLMAINYSEGSFLDQRQALGFNIYSSSPIAPIPVLMSGQPAWEKSKDWWGSLNTAWAALGGYEGAGFLNDYHPEFVPWAFVNAAPSHTEYVTDYFDGAGQNGLTIINAPDDQRYWCCFDLSAAAISLN